MDYENDTPLDVVKHPLTFRSCIHPCSFRARLYIKILIYRQSWPNDENWLLNLYFSNISIFHNVYENFPNFLGFDPGKQNPFSPLKNPSEILAESQLAKYSNWTISNYFLILSLWICPKLCDLPILSSSVRGNIFWGI